VVFVRNIASHTVDTLFVLLSASICAMSPTTLSAKRLIRRWTVLHKMTEVLTIIASDYGFPVIDPAGREPYHQPVVVMI